MPKNNLIIEELLKFNIIPYVGGVPQYGSTVVQKLCKIECDTVADLPSKNQTDFEFAMGTKAHIIEDNSWYAMQSDGTWKIQEVGTAGYTKDEIDQIIQDTKDYADSEILGAINDLDVPAVGGTTRYIYRISQADGLIYAEYYNSDSSPTTGSTKLVQSGGVKTYVDNQVSNLSSTIPSTITSNVFGQGTRILGTDDVHANMNDYWHEGNYYIATADNLGNIDNKPPNVLNSRAKILVFQFSGTLDTNNRCVQIWIPQRLPTTSADNPACFYMRYRTTNTQGEVSWTSWFQINGVALS